MKLFTIPNLLTLGNLFSGCLFILLSNALISDKYIGYILLFFLFISLLFDLLDGMVARLLKSNSEIGVQLDSLADMVSFGAVPGFLMYFMFNSLNSSFYLFDNSTFKMDEGFQLISFIGFFITLFSALRLAKFNVDTEQSSYFKGLATPANTILIFSLFWIQNQNGFIVSKEYDVYLLLGITLLSCYLLISNIPMFSFKLKGFAWKDNHYKYVFLIISIILLALIQINALPIIILLYIITSIIFRKNITNA